MNRPSSAASALAERLVSVAPAGQAGSSMDSVEAAFRQLRSRLVPIVGEGGHGVLLTRAVERATAEYPFLSTLNGADSVDDIMVVIRDLGTTHPSDEVIAGMRSVIASVVDLLARFVGEDMAIKIIGSAGPDRGREPS